MGDVRLIPNDNEAIKTLHPHSDQHPLPGETPSAFGRHGLVSVRDNLTNFTLVIDTLKSKNTLFSLSNRPVDPLMVLEANVSSFEGFDDDGVYASVEVSGSTTAMKEVNSRLKALQKDVDMIELMASGHSNSEDYPLTTYAIKNKKHALIEKGLAESVMHKQDGVERLSIPLTKPAMMALGAVRDTLQIKEHGATLSANKGDVLLFDEDRMSLEVLGPEQMTAYKKSPENWLEFEIDGPEIS